MYNVHSRQRNRRAAVPSSPGGGVRLFGGACSYTVLEFDPLLDSSSMTPKDWETIAATVEKHYYDYDGFVVIHGTDTMAYVKSNHAMFTRWGTGSCINARECAHENVYETETEIEIETETETERAERCHSSILYSVAFKY